MPATALIQAREAALHPLRLAWPKVKPAYNAAIWRLGHAYRLYLDDVMPVGVTGSCGKTIASRLMTAVLSSRGKVRENGQLKSEPLAVARAILALRPSDDFAVLEMGAHGPGAMSLSTGLVRPKVGVVTAIGDDHYDSFRGRDNVAAEKGILVESLPPDGCAVLNGDDPRVAAMAARTNARVLTYGTGDDVDIRAEAIRASWPDRLSFTVHHGNETAEVRTALIGAHLVTSVLAALATGVALGVPLAQGARRLDGATPIYGRLHPVETDDGITFLHDAYKAPLWSMAAAIDVMRDARAKRRIIVVGTLSDYPGDASRAYRRTARAALEAADLVYFVGPMAHVAAKEAKGEDADRLRIYERADVLNAHFTEELRAGDLVLIKGSHRADHLERLMLARSGGVACWRNICRAAIQCRGCGWRYLPDPADPGPLPDKA